MNPTFIAVGEYANYIEDNGKVYTHGNDNKLRDLNLPEPVQVKAAGHPSISNGGGGYAIGSSGALYMLWSGATPGFKKIADNIKLVAAYWQWCMVVHADGTMSLYKDGVKYAALTKKPGNVVEIKLAQVAMIRLDNGQVWFYEWTKAAWKADTVWYKTKAEIEALPAKQVVLPGAATSIGTSRTGFSAAIVDGKPYVWSDTFGSRYIGETAAVMTPKVINKAPAKPLVKVAVSDMNLFFIDNEGNLYGAGGDGPGMVGNGQMNQKIIDNGNFEHSWTTYVPPVQIAVGRKFSDIFTETSYGFRMVARETNGAINTWGYGKNGLLMNGIRVKDDAFSTEYSSVTTPHRIEIPQAITVVDTPTIKNMVAAGTYPPPEAGVPTPEPPVRKVVAILYDDGKWEKPAV